MTSPSFTIIGSSKIMRETLAKAERVARTSLPVMVTGETGTGKELFARFLHDHSPWAERPYVAINCAAIPSELLESELFGHKKGAFSGAQADRDGLFVQADGGTLFLDEIGDMPLPLQAKILRVLQEGEVRPLGDNRVRKVNVRIVAATHRDLNELVAQGKFREDLMFRLRGYALHLPPLRERERDVISLARAILRSYPEFAGKQMSRDLQELLLAYSWPGNVRELRNVILAAAVDASRTMEAQHLLPHLSGTDAPSTVAPVRPLKERLWSVLQQVGEVTLAHLHNLMRIPKPTLHYHIKNMIQQGKLRRLTDGGGVRFVPANDDAEQPTPEPSTAAVQVVEKAVRITCQQVASTVGIPIRTAGRVLAMLVNQGIMAPDGVGFRPCRC